MKKFVKKIVLFSLPIMIGLGGIFFIKTNREFCYNYVKGDCEGRGQLLYKKIYEGEANVDYLFVGSSKTWNDVNDKLLTNELNSSPSTDLHVFNSGYCRFGRNLDHLFCTEFLKHNKLKKIFLEVRADESTASHPMYPYLATGSEILEGTLALNTKLFPEVYDHLLMNINFVRHVITIENSDPIKEKVPLFGFNNIDRRMDIDQLDKFYNSEYERLKGSKTDTTSVGYRFSNYYLKKIKDLCDANNIELVFVYLPGYANLNKEPAFKTFYQKWGKIIMPPDSVYNNKSYWKDVAHLNAHGADAYSKFLVTQLAR